MFSPDGHWLVTIDADDETIIQLWDKMNLLTDPKPVDLPGQEETVRAIAFSNDSRMLATSSPDNSVRLWDLNKLMTDPVVLREHEKEVVELAFSSDGNWMVTVSSDYTIRRWHLKLNNLFSLACRIAGRNFSIEEWEQFLGDKPYHNTCTSL
jgi:WD40 repeat protein